MLAAVTRPDHAVLSRQIKDRPLSRPPRPRGRGPRLPRPSPRPPSPSSGSRLYFTKSLGGYLGQPAARGALWTVMAFPTHPGPAREKNAFAASPPAALTRRPSSPRSAVHAAYAAGTSLAGGENRTPRSSTPRQLEDRPQGVGRVSHRSPATGRGPIRKLPMNLHRSTSAATRPSTGHNTPPPKFFGRGPRPRARRAGPSSNGARFVLAGIKSRPGNTRRFFSPAARPWPCIR